MSDKEEYYSSASVVFNIRVKGRGHWDKNATVSEVQRIGGRETVNQVINALQQAGVDFEMIKEPKVGAITWEPTNGK